MRLLAGARGDERLTGECTESCEHRDQEMR